MPETRTITIELSPSEVDLLIEALDSHEYWQLSDPTWRNSGYVILPGEDLSLSRDRPVLDAAQHEAAEEILASRRLQDRLRVAAQDPRLGAVTQQTQNRAMSTIPEDRLAVWVLLIERDVEQGADLTLYWQEEAARAAAHDYLVEAWAGVGPLSEDLPAAIEIYNQIAGVGEHVLLAPFLIEGHHPVASDPAARPRCEVCGEPVVLADAGDPESWVHADDANDGGDHTAEVDPAPSDRRQSGASPPWAPA